MAREKHIKKLGIKNFKRFADFEVDNLGQFNLIVGDNNTGKTSFLEALLFDWEKHVWEMLWHLDYTFFNRNPSQDDTVINNLFQNWRILCNNIQHSEYGEGIRIWIDEWSCIIHFLNDGDLQFLNQIEVESWHQLSDLKHFLYKVYNKNRKHSDQVTTTLQKRNSKLVLDYHPFIPFGNGYNSDLIKFFSQKIDISRAKRITFIQNLKTFIPKVDDVRIGNNTINIYEEGRETPMPLFTYGEGANKLFRILCEIAMNEGKRLMIDEIDAGIHYGRFKDFWTTIMKMAKAYDVQIFATTHNQECITYFHDALEGAEGESYQDLARVVALKERKDGSVRARVYDYEQITYANDAEHELRGGRL